MNSTNVLKASLLSIVFASSAFVSALDTETIKNSVKATSEINLSKSDQAFAIARLTNRHPSLILGYPGKNALEAFDYGTKDQKTGDVRQVTVGNSADLENLVLIHEYLQMRDANLKIEHMYPGWADKILEMAAEDILRTFRILNSKPSDKNQFMVQALNRIPMKIVVKNVADLRAFITYLTGVYTKHSFIPTEKSILVLQIEDMSQELNDADCLFLDTYFNVINPTENEEVASFFERAQEYLDSSVEMRHDAYQIGVTLGETCMNQFKKIGSLNVHDHVALLLISTFGVWAGKKAIETGKSGINQLLNLPEVADKTKVITDKVNSISTEKFVIGVLVTLLGSYVAMKLINKLLESDNDSEKQAVLQELQAELEKKASEQKETQENVVAA